MQMKYIIFILLGFSISTSCQEKLTNNKSSGKNSPEKSKSLQVDNKTKEDKEVKLNYSFKEHNLKTLEDSVSFLNHYYSQFNSTQDSISEVLFFRHFPNDFQSFINLYGFNTTQGARPLYFEGENHIRNYFDIKNYIDDKAYYSKMISIALRGHWQADNVNTLQNILWKGFNQNRDIILNDLLKKNREAQKSFWIFFFDGPHPENRKKLFNQVINELSVYYEGKGISNIQDAYSEVKEDWKSH